LHTAIGKKQHHKLSIACSELVWQRETPALLVPRRNASGTQNRGSTGHTARGVKPVVQVAWGRNNFWVYGVVEPHSGWHFEQEYDQLNNGFGS
jgi:hypothetical protein